MNFDVFCDECYPDLLGSKKSKLEFLVIGSLWLPTTMRQKFKEDIHALRDSYLIGGEFKWGKVSPSRLDFYKSLIELFFSYDDSVRFRAIIVARKDVNLEFYHENDQELGFYKFYYQLLHHWILDFNEYKIFCDYKKNRDRTRLKILQRCLDSSNLSSDIPIIQSVRSEESVLIQFADVLSGAVAAKFNQVGKTDSAKSILIKEIEHRLNHKILPTGPYEKKFNIFKIDLQGGW